MFIFFNNKKRTFKKNLTKAANAFQVLACNPFSISFIKQEIAQKQLKEIREWWKINVDNYKNELSISESDFELMRNYLHLPDVAKYRNLNGKKTTYYPNGQIEYEWNYINGGKHGIQRGWHENGQLSFEQNYINDYMDGKQLSWYENGNLQSERNYKFTTENTDRLSEDIGWQKDFHENGFTKKKEFYNENTYKLENIIYYENGSIIRLSEYKNNEIYCKDYNKEGVIVKEWKIQR